MSTTSQISDFSCVKIECLGKTNKKTDDMSLSECFRRMQIAEYRSSIASLEAKNEGTDPEEAAEPYHREARMYEERAHKTMPSSWNDFLDALSLIRRGFDEGTDRDGLHDELLENLRKGMHMAFGHLQSSGSLS